MLGPFCVVLCLVVLSCVVLYWVVLGCVWLCWVVLGCVVFGRVVYRLSSARPRLLPQSHLHFQKKVSFFAQKKSFF